MDVLEAGFLIVFQCSTQSASFGAQTSLGREALVHRGFRATSDHAYRRSRHPHDAATGASDEREPYEQPEDAVGGHRFHHSLLSSRPVGVNGAWLVDGPSMCREVLQPAPCVVTGPRHRCGELRARDVLARDHIAETMDVVTVFVVALATALATGLGALPFVFARRPDRAWLGTANSLAAGLMLGATRGSSTRGRGTGRSELRSAHSRVASSSSYRSGSSTPTRRFTSARSGSGRAEGAADRGDHDPPLVRGGVGVGVAFGVEETLGIFIGLAIAVHNIPEGLAISLVLVPRGTSPRTAAGWSVFSSLPQPLMAVPAFLFVEDVPEFLPIGLGFAAGAMIWLVAADLVPEALETSKPWTVAYTRRSAAAMLAFVLLPAACLRPLASSPRAPGARSGCPDRPVPGDDRVM